VVVRIMGYILDKLKAGTASLDEEAIDLMLEHLRSAPVIYVYGAGRSGLVGRALAMRLMHLGLSVYVVGDTTTPAIQPGDLLLSISGSGETPSVRVVAEEAKRRGARLVTMTATPESSLARFSDLVVFVPSHIVRSGEEDYLARQVAGAHEPLTPLGTAFELTAMVLCDSIVVTLMQQLNRTERDMAAKHSTLQ
jgi:6-phospho-3-hexuloisomerase